MASSGFILGDTVEGSENSYLDWQLTSQSIPGNSSIIAWQAGWRFDDYSCRGLRKATAVINGVTVWNDQDAGDGVHAFNAGHDHNNGIGKLQLASGFRTIAHLANGTKTFSASIDLTGFNSQRSTGSDTWSLTTIPRNPNAPSTPVISFVTQTSAIVSWTPNPADGLPNTSYTISYGVTSGASDFTTTSGTSPKTITGLSPGVQYFFKVRATNSVGTGPYSGISNTTTIAGAFVINSFGVPKRAIPYVKHAGVWKVARPYVKLIEEWKETL